MKRIAITLAIILAIATVSCAAEPTKEKAPTSAAKTEQAQPMSPQQVQQNLQVQRATLALRIEGAMAAKSAVEKVILDGQVALAELDKQIQASQATKPEKPQADKVQEQAPKK